MKAAIVASQAAPVFVGHVSMEGHVGEREDCPICHERLTFSGDEARLIVSDLKHATAVQDWRRVGDVIRHLELQLNEEG